MDNLNKDRSAIIPIIPGARLFLLAEEPHRWARNREEDPEDSKNPVAIAESDGSNGEDRDDVNGE